MTLALAPCVDARKTSWLERDSNEKQGKQENTKHDVKAERIQQEHQAALARAEEARQAALAGVEAERQATNEATEKAEKEHKHAIAAANEKLRVTVKDTAIVTAQLQEAKKTLTAAEEKATAKRKKVSGEEEPRGNTMLWSERFLELGFFQAYEQLALRGCDLCSIGKGRVWLVRRCMYSFYVPLPPNPTKHGAS